MNSRNKITVCLAALASLLITGCSGEPSAGDIEKAVKADVAEANQRIQQMAEVSGVAGKPGGAMMKNLKIEVNAVKKIKCTPVKDSADFDCDIEIDLTLPTAGQTKKKGPARFTKTNDGWKSVH